MKVPAKKKKKKKNQDHVPYSFAYKVACIDNRFTKPITFLVVLISKLFVLMIGLLSQLLFIEVKMLLINLLKQFLRSISTAKK